MPVLMVGTYDEDGKVDVMMAAWGMTCQQDCNALNLQKYHKTVENIRASKAFTVSIADYAHMAEADYVGTVSGKTTPDKFEKSGLHAFRSETVNAPVIEEFPLAMECELEEIQEIGSLVRVVGRIVNISVDEKYLTSKGQPDTDRMNAIAWNPFNGGYYKVGEKVGMNCQEWKKKNLSHD